MSTLKEKLKREAEIIQRIRDYFNNTGFIEVFTPHLYPYPNLDGHIANFITFFENRKERKVQYLTTSPEYYMKELLSENVYPIYQITSAFRNGEIDDLHIPEFLILEWYEEGDNLDILIERTLQMLQFVYGDFITYNNRRISTDNIKVISSIDVLKKKGIDPDRIDDMEYLRSVCKDYNIFYSEDYEIDDVYWAIFYELVEKEIGNTIAFVKHFPYYTGGMAKVNKNFPLFTDRVECYICRIEIGNGYVESIDSKEMEERFKRYGEKYNWRYRKPDKFLKSLDNIKSDFVGMAVGVHRLPCIDINNWRRMMVL